MGRFFICILLGLYLGMARAALPVIDSEPPALPVGRFSAAKLTDLTPPGWTPLTFSNVERHSAYFLLRDGQTNVVKAYSDNAASGLYRKVDIDPVQHPLIQWRWKVDNLISRADVHRKEGDDYPARLYVSFAYDVERLSRIERVKVKLYTLLHGKPPPLAVINYIWDNKSAVGTIVPNAYTGRVKMIVVESGAQKLGQWLTEQRNILEDYQHAFGEPPGPITGIALMTDTDNTGQRATSYYGDITFHARTQR